MPKNFEFAERLKAHMRANPHDYDQNAFAPARRLWPGNAFSCGTACCIAGHAYLLQHNYMRWDASLFTRLGTDAKMTSQDHSDLITTVAQEALGLSTMEANLLFAGYGLWPIEFAAAYRNAVTDEQRVDVACLLLDALMAGKLESTVARHVARVSYALADDAGSDEEDDEEDDCEGEEEDEEEDEVEATSDYHRERELVGV